MAFNYLAGLITAPVVIDNRQVVEHATIAGIVEIDYATDVITFEKHVIAKQIGVNNTAWQIFKTGCCHGILQS